jgi:hypothetical protein
MIPPMFRFLEGNRPMAVDFRFPTHQHQACFGLVFPLVAEVN